MRWWRARSVVWCLFWGACLLLVAGTARAQSVESALSPGVLSKAHSKWEGQCRSCHIPFDRQAQDGLCLDCHKDLGRDMAAKQGFHGRMPKRANCRSCHTDHKGREAVIVNFNPKSFDHEQTDYPLRNRHKAVACESCHQSGQKYSAAPQDCVSCHRKHDVHKGSLGGRCDSCHSDKGWLDTRFDHSSTRFALQGAHAQTKCSACHRTSEYRDTPTTCIGCHRKNDKHRGQFSEKCDSCHTESRWSQLTFRHDADTRYPLVGRHKEAKCVSCHTGVLYRDKTPTTCVDCHRKDDKHQGSLGSDCVSCHTERGWKEVVKFDHDRTSFPLLGKHVQVNCRSCHATPVYRETPSTCLGCHRKDDRHEGSLGERCDSCHAEASWKALRFDHARTRFALTGAHASPPLRCTSCHRDHKSYRDTATRCHSCHAKDDRHEGQLGQRCESCHGDQRWTGVNYDHNRARFALTGAHQNVACASCHLTPRYRDAASTCVACHRKQDVHRARLGENCQSCHNTRAWRLWRFDHDSQTRYPLASGHQRAKCDACHIQPAPVGQAIAPVSSQCVSCHAKDDAHDRNFGVRCEQCHDATRWRQISNRKLLPASSGAPT